MATRTKKNAGDVARAYLFLAPAAIVMIVFLYYPLVTSLGYSCFSFENFAPSRFIGLQNYNEAFHDKIFVNSIMLTFKWVLLNAFVPTLAGLALALALELYTKARWMTNAARTIFFMPMMMSLVAVGLLWTLIYDPNIGIISGLMQELGIEGKFVAYGNLDTALYMAYIPVVWQSSGFAMVVFSAALQGIPREIVEASMVEGANKFKRMRFILLPGIVKTITMITIVNMISGFKAFDLLYVLTRGGPGASTTITSVYAYVQAFFSFRFEYSSAMMAFLLVCVIAFLLVFNRLSKLLERRYGA
jgi:ABC-type sugar transport system permease subunit